MEAVIGLLAIAYLVITNKGNNRCSVAISAIVLIVMVVRVFFMSIELQIVRSSIYAIDATVILNKPFIGINHEKSNFDFTSTAVGEGNSF